MIQKQIFSAHSLNSVVWT